MATQGHACGTTDNPGMRMKGCVQPRNLAVACNSLAARVCIRHACHTWSLHTFWYNLIDTNVAARNRWIMYR